MLTIFLPGCASNRNQEEEWKKMQHRITDLKRWNKNGKIVKWFKKEKKIVTLCAPGFHPFIQQQEWQKKTFNWFRNNDFGSLGGMGVTKIERKNGTKKK